MVVAAALGVHDDILVFVCKAVQTAATPVAREPVPPPCLPPEPRSNAHFQAAVRRDVDKLGDAPEAADDAQAWVRMRVKVEVVHILLLENNAVRVCMETQVMW